MQHVSDRGASAQNRQIFSEPLSENDFLVPIYITSVLRNIYMHSKDPPEKYLAASSKRSTRLRSGGERVEGEARELKRTPLPHPEGWI